MATNTRSNSLLRIAALAVVAVLAVLLVVGFRGQPTPQGEPGDQAKDLGLRESSAGFSPDQGRPPGLDVGESTASADPAQLAAEQLPEDQGSEYPVDMAALRAKIPDNLYWQVGEPTKDPKVLQARAEEEKRWNTLFGKVQANEASEEEIQRYYEHRRQLSEDYIEFASLALEEYGDRLPERDRGMYELSINLHRARLQELPRQIDDALARKKVQDQRRAEWLESQGRSQ